MADQPDYPLRRPALVCVKLPKIDIVRIPPRRWAYGHFLLFGKTAALAAVDGGGKGAMAAAIVLSFITGRGLLGENVWRKGPVAIISYEDDTEEWHRRIAAACIYYGADYDDVLDHITFIAHPDGSRVCFATMGPRQGPVFPDGDEIVGMLREIGAVLLVIDPFNLSHGFEDGNNNVMIAKVAAEMDRICDQSGCAGLLLHHLRKGSTGQIDDMMGATSLRATFRSCRVVAKMLPDEAKALSIDKDVWRYSRIASVKANHAPPPEKATWYRLDSVELGNGIEDYPDGDSVGVTATWCPRAMFEGMPPETIGAVFDALGKTEHSISRQAKHTPWAGGPLMQHGGRSEREASIILKSWIESGVLVKGEYYHSASKNTVSCVTLDNEKVAEIMAGLSMSEPPFE